MQIQFVIPPYVTNFYRKVNPFVPPRTQILEDAGKHLGPQIGWRAQAGKLSLTLTALVRNAAVKERPELDELWPVDLRPHRIKAVKGFTASPEQVYQAEVSKRVVTVMDQLEMLQGLCSNKREPIDHDNVFNALRSVLKTLHPLVK